MEFALSEFDHTPELKVHCPNLGVSSDYANHTKSYLLYYTPVIELTFLGNNCLEEQVEKEIPITSKIKANVSIIFITLSINLKIDFFGFD
jgi:hypothetical protein